MAFALFIVLVLGFLLGITIIGCIYLFIRYILNRQPNSNKYMVVGLLLGFFVVILAVITLNSFVSELA